MKIIKSVLTIVFVLSFALSVDARVKYTDEMKSFIGNWTRQDKQGDYYAYSFYVSDGWLIMRYKYIDHFHDGTELEGVANTNLNVDYTYNNGAFHYDYNTPGAKNSFTLQLKEGSLAVTHYRQVLDDRGKVEYTDTHEWVYDLDF